MIKSFFILTIILTMPLIFGAVQTVTWCFYTVVMACLFLVMWWREKTCFRFLDSPLFIFSVGSFLIYTLMQTIPLPVWIIKYLSPHQYQLLNESSAITGIIIKWQPLSYNWRSSLAWWIFLVGIVLFVQVFQTWILNRRNLLLVVWAMIALAMLEAGYGLIQTLVPTLGVLWADVEAYLGNARGTFINRNHFAGFIEMVWPLGLAMIFALLNSGAIETKNNRTLRDRIKYFLSSERFGLQLFLWVAMLFTLLALLFSRSRAGVTAAMIGGGTFILLTYLGGKRFSILTWAAMGLGCVFLLFYSDVIGFKNITGRFLIVEEGMASRTDIWKDTMTIVRDHPLGIGLRNYEQVMPVYNTRGPINIQYTHAHNDYIELLAEAGWPGFIFITSGFLLFLATMFRNIKRYGPRLEPINFFIAVGACSGLVSIGFHSFFDFNLQIPSNLVYCLLLISIGAVAVQPAMAVEDKPLFSSNHQAQ